MMNRVFFFNDTATTEIYTLSLHDALPILEGSWLKIRTLQFCSQKNKHARAEDVGQTNGTAYRNKGSPRSEEHTSELQSRQYLVCRLLLEKKLSTSILVTHQPYLTRTRLPS